MWTSVKKNESGREIAGLLMISLLIWSGGIWGAENLYYCTTNMANKGDVLLSPAMISTELNKISTDSSIDQNTGKLVNAKGYLSECLATKASDGHTLQVGDMDECLQAVFPQGVKNVNLYQKQIKALELPENKCGCTVLSPR